MATTAIDSLTPQAVSSVDTAEAPSATVKPDLAVTAVKTGLTADATTSSDLSALLPFQDPVVTAPLSAKGDKLSSQDPEAAQVPEGSQVPEGVQVSKAAPGPVATQSSEVGLHDVLAHLRAHSTSAKEQGLSFERLVGQILSSAQPWCERYAAVESYQQWARKHPTLTDTSRDLGIDLVATNKLPPMNNGVNTNESQFAELRTLCPDAPWGYTAIQCKFFGRDYAIPKSELDSFIAESNRPYFTGRCLVHTGTLGSNAILALNHCVPAVQVISIHELCAVNINWAHLLEHNEVELTHRKLRPYQSEALNAVISGFKEHERGQLIMACGTGKTLTSLKIAEKQLGPNGMVLYLAPALSLVSQSLTEWKRQCDRPIKAFAVCSDSKIGQTKQERNEELNISLMAPSELAYPVTTDAQKLATAIAAARADAAADEHGIIAIFSTYQSLDVIYQAQHAYGLADFDLIICDEAHRTAGAYLASERNLGIAAAQTMGLEPKVSALGDSAVADRATADSALGDSAAADPATADSALGDSAAADHATADSALGDSAAVDRATADSALGDSAAADRVSADSATVDRAVLTQTLQLDAGSGKRAAARRTRALYGNESTFTRIHNNDYIHSAKRLYMSATPKIYTGVAKEQEAKNEAVLYSMDNREVFGPVFYTLNFDRAVKYGCLVDFKVCILIGDKSLFPSDWQVEQFSQNSMAKMVGVWKAINHYGLEERGAPMKHLLVFTQYITSDHNPRKIGSKQFCEYLQESVDSYRSHVLALQHLDPNNERVQAEAAYMLSHKLRCACRHIDGSMDAVAKGETLEWFTSEPDAGVCHVLSNARCCGEGGDMPSLDGIVLMNPRRSQLELVQMVGRVMRTAPGKSCGYVIIPIVTNDLNHPESAFTKNKEFDIVWQVLGALKTINQDTVLVDGVTGKLDSRIEVICMQREAISARLPAVPYVEVGSEIGARAASGTDGASVMEKSAAVSLETVATVEPEPPNSPELEPNGSKQASYSTEPVSDCTELAGAARAEQLWQQHCAQAMAREQARLFEQACWLEMGVASHIIKQVGNRKEWEDWAAVVALKCQEQTVELTALVAEAHNQELFRHFATAFNASIKQHMSDEAIIEFLSQFMVLKPILNQLLPGCDFTRHNPIGSACATILELLDPEGKVSSSEQLKEFYLSVELRLANVTTPQERQTVMLELFERFFKVAFPKLQSKLGIVYTPLEIVDYINHSVQAILVTEFGSSLAQPNVHILDPFTGTGTFIARMMQCPDLITPEALPNKYQHDLHAFEIVPLAYFIASSNVQSTYQELIYQQARAQQELGQQALVQLEPNHVVVLTDTFETDEVVGGRAQAQRHDDAVLQEAVSSLDENGALRSHVNNLPLQVIVGNPPYSVGQASQNDDNQNERYPELEQRISETYAASIVEDKMKRALYDSYIKAYRWASDHIGPQGVIGFVTNGAWIDNQVSEGMRRCFEHEFSAVYVINLKGNRRCTGDYGQRQGANIFGDGSRATVAITLLVKNPKWQGPARILYGEVPDYLNTQAKLEQLHQWGSIAQTPLIEITPDKYGDWVNQRCDEFGAFLPMDADLAVEERRAVLSGKPVVKVGAAAAEQSAVGRASVLRGIFTNSSCGVLTCRDYWSYNASRAQLEQNFTRCITTINEQVDAKAEAQRQGKRFERCNDPTKIKWDLDKKKALNTGKHYPPMDPRFIRTTLYRPFTKTNLYYDPQWLERTYRMDAIFPEAGCANLVIAVTDKTNKFRFSCLMSDELCDYASIRIASHCFPRYLYLPKAEAQDLGIVPNAVPGLMGLIEPEPEWAQRYVRVDAIRPEVVAYFKEPYGKKGRDISADDVFYYIYGILNSADYRTTYRHNLSKERPRIPRVAQYEDFLAFADAGRKLGQLHVGYEQVKPYDGYTLCYAQGVTAENMDYRIEKLSYGRIKGKQGLAAEDKTIVRYNRDLTIKDIPLQAQEYIVGEQSPLDWVIDRYKVTVDSSSHIPNDINLLHPDNPRYILELIGRAITVGLESSAIIKAMPSLTIHKLDRRC